MHRLACLLLLCPTIAGPVHALDHVVFKQDGKELRVSGRVEVASKDWGVVLVGRDGMLWRIPAKQLVSHTRDDVPFKPLSGDELAKQLMGELPKGFQVYKTAHYVILHDTSKSYAQWCGAMLERFYTAFRTFWTNQKVALREPEFPLVAIIFADKQAYLKYANATVGELNDQIVAYFYPDANRMVMYDLTGAAAAGRAGGARIPVSQFLTLPNAAKLISTVIHEATHQLTFNFGILARHVSCPVWFNEGLAVFFEAPDLSKAAKGWGTIGKVDPSRLNQFRRYLGGRPANSLETLLAGDARFRDPKQATDAYAEAWALTYFFLQKYRKPYVQYMATLAKLDPLAEDAAETRLKQFQAVFGDLKSLDREFLRYMQTVK
jgi:hypothetical protein